MQSQADRISALQSIRGFLIPVFSSDPLPGVKQTFGLSGQDFKKVTEGYACSECLADYGTYRPVCPVCGHQQDLGQDVTQAVEWERYLRARKEAEENPVQQPRTPQMHERVEQLMRSRKDD